MASITYTLAGRSYSTKKALTEALREVLYKYEPEDDILGEDADFLSEVLDLHPDRARKVGVGVKRLFVRINAAYGGNNRCFWLERLDGTETDWSFVECLSPSSNKKKVKSALRLAIHDQIADFKRNYFLKPGPKVCPYTGKHLTPFNSHVDHVAPLEFDVLFEKFFALRGVDPAKLQVVPHLDGDTDDFLADADLVKDWQGYHESEAVLRVLSVEGNLSHAKIDRWIEKQVGGR